MSAEQKFAFYHVQNKLAQVTRISFAFPLGSVKDPMDKQGLTSLTLDVVQKGAVDLNSKQISEMLALYGASAEFMVGRHTTIFQIDVLSEYLEPCVKLLKRVLMTATFPGKEFDLLKAQYISDIKANLESNRSILWRAYQRWYHAESPLNNLGGGTLASINNITVKDVRAWYKNLLSTDSMKIFYTSDLPSSEVETLVRRYFSWVPVAKSTTPVSPALLKKPKGIEVVIIDNPESQTGDFMFAQPGISFDVGKKLYYAAHLGNEAFGSGMQSRLFVELRDKRGWTYHASSRYWGTFYHDYPLPWVMYSFPSLQFTQKAVELSYKLAQQYFAEGLTDDEIELYRTSMIRIYPFTIATPSNQIDKRYDEVINGRFPLSQKEREGILKSISNKEIQALLKKVHDPQNFVFLIVGDAKAIKGWIPKVFKKTASIKVLKPDQIL